LRSRAFQWFVRGIGFALGVALIVVVVAGVALAARAVLILFFALLTASGLQPVVDWVRARSRLGRGATVLVVYLAFFLGVVVLALLIVPGAISQFNDLGVRLAPVLADARAWAQGIEPRALSASLSALIDAFARQIAPAGEGAPPPEQLIAVGMTLADLLITLVSILALVFFWLTERARLQRFALALVPAERRGGAREAWNEIELRLGSWVRGQLILMASVGVMTTVAYFLIGLEGALLLGLIAALTEAIPLIGPAIGAVPALIVAAATGQLETVVLVGLVYVGIHVIEGNVLVPLVMRNTIGIPPFVVLASILAGAQIGGLVGAFVAVPAAASLLVILERLQAREEHVPIERETVDPEREAVDLERETVDADALSPDPTAREQLAATEPKSSD
jgi:predicted PurR-regulated permease PerM